MLRKVLIALILCFLFSIRVSANAHNTMEMLKDLKDRIARQEESFNLIYHELQSNRFQKFIRISKETGMPVHIVQTVFNESEKHNIDPNIFLGLIRLESNFNPYLINYNTNGTIDIGLCQINRESTAEWLWKSVYPHKHFNEYYLFKPQVSIELSAWYLGYLLKTYNGDYKKALTAYNMGVGGLASYMRAYGTPESPYYRGVIRHSLRFTEIFNGLRG